MATGTREERFLQQVDPRSYNVLVGKDSIMLLPLDPLNQGGANVLYLCNPEYHPEEIEVLVHWLNDPLHQSNITTNVNKE
jgi:hypothetical protein